MSGGATPDGSGEAIILKLVRMNAVRAFEPATRQICVEAGMILQNLHEMVEAEGLRFPLTLGGKGSATIGGLVATNAGGTQVLRHGTMRAQVLGVEAVMPDGSVLDMLVPLKKDNRGFDLKQLLIGSEGTLGIVTAATLRLLPQVAERVVLWAGLDAVTDARALLEFCENEVGDLIEGFEIMPHHSLAAVLDHLPNARPPLSGEHQWHALIELVAEKGAEIDLQARAEALLEAAFERSLIADATISANETQAEQFWLLRDSVAPAERAVGPAMQHDISVPVAKMADFIDHALPAVEAAFPRHRAIAFGHLGDGNVHFHVLAPPGSEREEWERDYGAKVSRAVHDLVNQWGGSISAEHGIGQSKVAELERLGDPTALATMRAVKQALDPLGIMNPGKLVRLAPGGASA